MRINCEMARMGQQQQRGDEIEERCDRTVKRIYSIRPHTKKQLSDQLLSRNGGGSLEMPRQSVIRGAGEGYVENQDWGSRRRQNESLNLGTG